MREMIVNGQRVATSDGSAVIGETALRVTAEQDAEFILVQAA